MHIRGGDELFPVTYALENGIAGIAAIDHMIKGTRVFNSKGP